jgi:hypothetical protein
MSDADKKIRHTGFKPRLGSQVRLWYGPGLWSVWSKGSAAGTWFIQPVDAEANAACQSPDLLDDVAEQVWPYAIEVKTNEMGNPIAVESA